MLALFANVATHTRLTIPSEQAYQEHHSKNLIKPYMSAFSFGFVIFIAPHFIFLDMVKSITDKAVEKQQRFNMGWQKGQSGNENGRPVGSGRTQIVRRIIADVFGDESGAIRKVAELAQEGDLQACSLLLSKTVPPLRSSHEAVTLIDAETLGAMTASQRAALINEASITGRLPPDVALLLLDGIQKEYQITESTELCERFEALELKLNQRGKA